MAATRKSTTPDVVHFDLDVAEEQRAEEVQGREPFVANIRGRKITMIDAKDLDWQLLLDMTHPVDFVENCLNPEDKHFFLSQTISGAVINMLMDRYFDHYGIKRNRR